MKKWKLVLYYYDFNEGGGTEIYDKARHTHSLFNVGIGWETGSGPIEDCASPAPDSNPLITGIEGYRYVSLTEAYLVNQMEDLQKDIEEFYPF